MELRPETRRPTRVVVRSAMAVLVRLPRVARGALVRSGATWHHGIGPRGTPRVRGASAAAGAEASAESPRGRSMPAEMRYFDTAKILVRGGDGGNGCVAFRREKFVAHGGPAGGNGGRGGHVWIVADGSLNSLRTFRKQIHFRAKPGGHGQGSKCEGRAASDMHVKVPPGTVIKDAETMEVLAELVKHGDQAVIAKGGRGGRGNASFKSSKNKTPQLAEKGEAGQELWLELELKLVADVGIVGCPNAGKSTLLSVVSNAKPKIANYPFTTLTPNLGVCEQDFESVVFADVPGLLEGAHDGVGLGKEFLRHCERCRILLHMVDGSSKDPLGDYHAIVNELSLFSPRFGSKPTVIGFNKMDLPKAQENWETLKAEFEKCGLPVFPLSTATGEGVVNVVRKVREIMKELPEEDLQSVIPPTGKLGGSNYGHGKQDYEDFAIEEMLHVRTWIIHGEGLERFVQMTNWQYFESVKRFQKVLDVSGLSQELQKRGIKNGDTVIIGDLEFEWDDDFSLAHMYEKWLDTERKPLGSSRWPHPV